VIFQQFVVGLSGTHGTGKSTILSGAEQRGVEVNKTSLSREAQRSLGWDRLSRAEESITNVWNLQYAILGAMRQRDVNIEGSGRHVLVDRTPADVWAYTEMWCQRFGIDTTADARAVAFKERCHYMMLSYATIVVVPPVPEIPFVPEPGRADSKSREMVQRVIEDFIWEKPVPTVTIKTPRIEDRVEIVVELIKGLS
jgi:predicted ATPase